MNFTTTLLVIRYTNLSPHLRHCLLNTKPWEKTRRSCCLKLFLSCMWIAAADRNITATVIFIVWNTIFVQWSIMFLFSFFFIVVYWYVFASLYHLSVYNILNIFLSLLMRILLSYLLWFFFLFRRSNSILWRVNLLRFQMSILICFGWDQHKKLKNILSFIKDTHSLYFNKHYKKMCDTKIKQNKFSLDWI